MIGSHLIGVHYLDDNTDNSRYISCRAPIERQRADTVDSHCEYTTTLNYLL